MAKKEVSLKKLDELGTELSKLKAKKSELNAKLDLISADEAKVQEEFIQLLLSADKDSWVIKGVGKLSLSTRTYFNVKSYQTFLEWSKSEEAESFGITAELVADNTTLSMKGLSEVLKEVQAAKKADFDFEKSIGISIYKKTSISKSADKAKK